MHNLSGQDTERIQSTTYQEIEHRKGTIRKSSGQSTVQYRTGQDPGGFCCPPNWHDFIGTRCDFILLSCCPFVILYTSISFWCFFGSCVFQLFAFFYLMCLSYVYVFDPLRTIIAPILYYTTLHYSVLFGAANTAYWDVLAAEPWGKEPTAYSAEYEKEWASGNLGCHSCRLAPREFLVVSKSYTINSISIIAPKG